MHNPSFAYRLHVARLFCHYSLDQLARATNLKITRQSLYRYERGDMLPRPSTLSALARALGVSEDYFKGTSLNIDLPMLRTAPGYHFSPRDEEVLKTQLSYWSERYIRMEKEAFNTPMFQNPLASVKITSYGEATTASALLRKMWNCGEGPITSLLRLFERKGIKVLDLALPEAIFGLSTWADDHYPLMVLDMRPKKTTTERLRFTAAHELAHLLLKFSNDDTTFQEKCCNKFASFFLFPRDTFIEEMGKSHRTTLYLDEMIDLKSVYGISVAAQVHEAYDIGMISRQHYDWWYNEMIHKNSKEEGWGSYPYSETIGREKRIASILNNNISI